MLSISLLSLSLSLAASTWATPLSTGYHYDARKDCPFGLAPLFTAAHEAPYGLVNNSYIVMFKKGLSPVAMGNHLNFLQSAHSEDPLLECDNGLRHVFDSHIKGYIRKMTFARMTRMTRMAGMARAPDCWLVRAKGGNGLGEGPHVLEELQQVANMSTMVEDLSKVAQVLKGSVIAGAGVRGDWEGGVKALLVFSKKGMACGEAHGSGAGATCERDLMLLNRPVATVLVGLDNRAQLAIRSFKDYFL
ncbi:hypothetical protein B0F90DRAFT_1919413 [Multifurca ochricompacta]|uniref:Uncharacterized protein n=1 Tax=Multifurca ochricompacta TaxID=376703 RepID=A0AAD4QL14_9AGAM|nr:hypothetical protein B0F90DRAFT_1919413 [Multifurca ochricompacta]